jgi:hypothetical protein
MISLMKRNVLFTALATLVFGICFVLLWPVARFLVEDTPSLTFAAGGLCVVLSGTITLRLIRNLMSVPQKD